ncbi:MAG: tetraacyldisaccharide 4'-kinase [Gammaproteobacteria bacterium]
MATLKEKIVQSWYQTSPLTIFLRPLSRLYEKVISFRKNFLTKRALKIQVPVIVIGNITVGGTGKTPLIMKLYEALKGEGFQPGIVSRGYLSQLSSDFPILLKEHHGPEDVGDEPYMIYRRIKAPVMICKDRVKAIEALLTIMPSVNVILSDDGLQHYSMQRDIEVAVIDGDRRFGNGELLPAGPLREPISRLKSVDFAVCQGIPQGNELSMKLVGETLCALNNPHLTQSLRDLKSMTVHAVAGIGHPERFFKNLSAHGLNVIPHPFPDHHLFQASDFDFKTMAPIIMTEKDAVKCMQLSIPNAWYLPVNAEVDPNLIQAILRKLRHG